MTTSKTEWWWKKPWSEIDWEMIFALSKMAKISWIIFLRRGKFVEPASSPRPGWSLTRFQHAKKRRTRGPAWNQIDGVLAGHPCCCAHNVLRLVEDIYCTYDFGVNSFITKPVTFEGLVTITAIWQVLVRNCWASCPKRQMTCSKLSFVRFWFDDDEEGLVPVQETLDEIQGTRIKLDWVSQSTELSTISRARNTISTFSTTGLDNEMV